MIGTLRGRVTLRNSPYIIVDVSGVGYKVLVAQTLFSHAELESEVKLYTYTHVRDDALELYGFTAVEDLRLFEYLIGVSGVGCKTALGIFSVGSRDEILQAIKSGDVSFFSGVPRLGKKNAQKIIIELRSKLGDRSELDLTSQADGISDDAVTALQGFGFSVREAHQALAAIKGEGESIEEKVRLALKHLGR